MSYEVTLASEAKRDLREICRYIAAGPQSEPNANGQLNRLEKNILKLDEMPERFRGHVGGQFPRVLHLEPSGKPLQCFALCTADRTLTPSPAML